MYRVTAGFSLPSASALSMSNLYCISASKNSLLLT